MQYLEVTNIVLQNIFSKEKIILNHGIGKKLFEVQNISARYQINCQKFITRS